MRVGLTTEVMLADAVFSLQRGELLQALIAERRFELFSEALRDRLHQPHRVHHGPGLVDVLRLNDQIREYPGFLGAAMSGAGSGRVALGADDFFLVAREETSPFAATRGQS